MRRQRHAQIAEELGIPHAFTLSDIQLRLERYSGRAVHVAAAELDSGSPSGFCFRKDRAEYLFYERRTSPFHQAHIVLHLAAHALLADGRGAALDHRLTPLVGAELVRLILGDVTSSQVSDTEADDFAFLALRSANRSVTRFQAARSLRRIEPLRWALLSVVPQAARASGETALPGATRRLYQAVIEIREAALALRSYREPEVAASANERCRAAGLAGRNLAAAVEATVLAGAVQAKQAGMPACEKPDNNDDPVAAQADLASEAAWLTQVSRALTRDPHGIKPKR